MQSRLSFFEPFVLRDVFKIFSLYNDGSRRLIAHYGPVDELPAHGKRAVKGTPGILTRFLRGGCLKSDIRSHHVTYYAVFEVSWQHDLRVFRR
jgi:hypothetical protein